MNADGRLTLDGLTDHGTY